MDGECLIQHNDWGSNGTYRKGFKANTKSDIICLKNYFLKLISTTYLKRRQQRNKGQTSFDSEFEFWAREVVLENQV